ncbi:MAG: helicase, partial [bacterium]|nr:helicase [bacterium]
GFRRKLISGRQTHPPTGRFWPQVLVDQPEKGHDHLLEPSRQSPRPPWPIRWTRLALDSRIDEGTAIDLLREVLRQGTATGLFRILRQDGPKTWYAIAAGAARLVAGDAVALQCSDTKRYLFRPAAEAEIWKSSPSLEYRARPNSAYREAAAKPRHLYYQRRYRRGALRRVMAFEHTGLLRTADREDVERRFAATDGKHADDPNVLTCTSTLEMGIDIGDLSSTMLCAIPPSTASYIQRIGRAGRATGTSLIVSVVNQKPHDLFFYARPAEMIRGAVEPPGCWLDASAVLVRHYLGYCFDAAAKDGILKRIPRTGSQLVEDMEGSEGNLRGMFRWVGENE